MNNTLEEFENQNVSLFQISYPKAIFYLLIFLVGLVPAAIFQGLTMFIFGAEEEIGKFFLTISNIIPFIVVILMAYLWSKNEKQSFRFNFSLSWSLLPIISLLMLSVMMLSSYTTTFVPHDSGWLKEVYTLFEEAFKSLMDPAWILVLATCIFAPVFEEILFRGILLKGLINRSKNEKEVWLAILFTSFMFGLIHMNPWQFIAAMISGIALGYVYYRTKSLGNTIFMHALNNGISVYVLLQYGEMEPAELSAYPEGYNVLLLLAYVGLMYLIYFLTKKNTSRFIK